MACQVTANLKLMVIVPRNRHSRANTVTQTLAGTDIRVMLDRRRRARRSARRPVTMERRLGDRRTPPQVVAYVYACPVVTVGMTPIGGAAGAAYQAAAQ